MMPPIMVSSSRKSSNTVPLTIFRCYLLGDKPIKIKHFFMGSRGFLWVWIMGSQNVMGSDYGSNISVVD
jgi:hypothetical protein